MFRINISGDATGFLCFSNYVKGKRSLAGTLRAIDFHDPPTRDAAHANSSIEAQGGGGNCRDVRDFAFTQAHDRSFTKPLFNVCKCCFYSFASVHHHSIVSHNIHRFLPLLFSHFMALTPLSNPGLLVSVAHKPREWNSVSRLQQRLVLV